MAKEIERKFLIDELLLPNLQDGFRISQGYIRTIGKTVVRVRVKNDLAFLTLKGEINGMTCSEFEYEIPTQDAKEMISELCLGATVDKTRYEIQHESHLWEIDVFHGENKEMFIVVSKGINCQRDVIVNNRKDTRSRCLIDFKPMYRFGTSFKDLQDVGVEFPKKNH